MKVYHKIIAYLLSWLFVLTAYGQAPTITNFGNATPSSDYYQMKAGYNACKSDPSDLYTVLGTNFTSNTTISSSGLAVDAIFINATEMHFTIPELPAGTSGAYTGIIQLDNGTGIATTSLLGTFGVFPCPTFPSSVLGINQTYTITGNDLASINPFTTALSVAGVSLGGIFDPGTQQIYISIPNNNGILGIDKVLFDVNTSLLGTILLASQDINFVDFAVNNPPVIVSLGPPSQMIGGGVNVIGNNFSSAPENIVFAGGMSAIVTSNNLNNLAIIAPPGATYEPMTVLNTSTTLIGQYFVPLNIIPPTPPTVTGYQFVYADTLAAVFAGAKQIEYADLNNDGRLDIIVSDKITNGGLSVYRNDGAAGASITGSTFTNIGYIGGINGSVIGKFAIADLDNNGKLDIVVQDGNKIALIKNIYTGGTLKPADFIRYDIVTASSVWGNMSIADVDSDGWLDLMSVSDNTIVHFFKNMQNFNFTDAHTINLGLSIGESFLTDIDGDQLPDVAAINVLNNKLMVYRNTGQVNTITSATFPAQLTTTLSITPGLAKIADFNVDGRLDFAIVQNDGKAINFYKNNSSVGAISINFANQLPLSIPIVGIDVEQIDGDEYPDIVVVQDSITILKNNSNISAIDFSLPGIKSPLVVPPSANSTALGIAAGDLDLDGLPDIGVTFVDGFIALYNNTGVGCNMPMILSQPGNFSLCAGAGTTLSAIVSGATDFQWEASQDFGATYTPVNKPGTFSGTTTPDLVITNISTTENNWRFRLVASSPCGSVISNIFIVTVNSIPTIVQEPISQSVCQGGGTAVFTPVTGGGNMVYRWQEFTLGTWNNLTDNAVYQGVSSSVLSLVNPSLALNNKKYRVIISNQCGIPDTSNGAAMLTFYKNPTIVRQPVDATVCEGNGIAKFIASVTGSNILYQWQEFNGFVWYNLPNVAPYQNTNKDTLSIINPDSALNLRQYRVVAINICGVVATSTGLSTIIVNPTARILKQPQSPAGICQDDGKVNIFVGLKGSGLSLLWQKFAIDTGWINLDNVSYYTGAFTQTLSITNPPATLNGTRYRLKITGTGCSAATLFSDSTIFITVYKATPNIPIAGQPRPAAPVCDKAGRAMLSVSVIGNNIDYQWEKLGGNVWQTISEDSIYTGTNRSTLYINNPDTTMHGTRYRVRANGSCSNAVIYSDSFASISIYRRPRIIKNVAADCNFGNSYLLIPADTNYKTYQWLLDGSQLYGAANNQYSVLLNGNYSAFVNSTPGCATPLINFGSTLLDIKPSISGSGTPKDTLLSTDSSGIAYQWYVDNLLIAGYSKSFLLVYYQGNYHVTITYATSCTGTSDTYKVANPDFLPVSKADAYFTDSSIYFKTQATKGLLQISPNPSEGMLRIQYKSAGNEPVFLSVYDSKGICIRRMTLHKSSTIEYHGEIQAGQLSPGVYQLQLIDGNQIKWSKVVIY